MKITINHGKKFSVIFLHLVKESRCMQGRSDSNGVRLACSPKPLIESFAAV